MNVISILEWQIKREIEKLNSLVEDTYGWDHDYLFEEEIKKAQDLFKTRLTILGKEYSDIELDNTLYKAFLDELYFYYLDDNGVFIDVYKLINNQDFKIDVALKYLTVFPDIVYENDTDILDIFLNIGSVNKRNELFHLLKTRGLNPSNNEMLKEHYLYNLNDLYNKVSSKDIVKGLNLFKEVTEGNLIEAVYLLDNNYERIYLIDELMKKDLLDKDTYYYFYEAFLSVDDQITYITEFLKEDKNHFINNYLEDLDKLSFRIINNEDFNSDIIDYLADKNINTDIKKLKLY